MSHIHILVSDKKMTKWKPEDNLNDIVDLFFKNEK